MNNRVGRLGDGPIDPDEVVTYVVPDSGEPVDDASTVRLGHLYGERLLHREHDLFVAPAGLGRHVQDLIRARLRTERFDEDDADEWAFRNWHRHLPLPRDRDEASRDARRCDHVVQAALAYRDTGMPNDEAFAWTIRSVGATYAVHIRQHGWHPEAYSALLRACHQHGPAIEDADAWIEVPIAWWRVLRYVEAGLRMPEALAQERRRLSGEDVDAPLDMLIALRRSPSV